MEAYQLQTIAVSQSNVAHKVYCFIPLHKEKKTNGSLKISETYTGAFERHNLEVFFF